MNKIVDCFIFYNELDMLEYRLNVLNDVVDYFILVESNYTFVGKNKPLYYSDNKDKFSKYSDKIIHVVVDLPYKYPEIDYKKTQQWMNENYQRESIEIGLNKLNLDTSDILIISDVDEIPNPKLLETVQQGKIKIETIKSLGQDLYYYNLTTHLGKTWTHPKILSYKFYQTIRNANSIRNLNCEMLPNGGWHLSYFGDKNFIRNKMENFSHQELNTEQNLNLDHIQNSIINKRNFFAYESFRNLPIEQNTNLPPNHTFFDYLNV